MVRVILFLLTNLSVMFIFGTVLFLTGIKSNSIKSLMILSGIVGFSGSITSVLLSKWSALKSVRAKIINSPSNLKEAWIVEAVRYQCSLIGIKMPDIAIYETNEVNAFASGYSKNNAVLALSSGLLKKMNRENIQAVIAHELSHIVNGDMVTLALLQGVINTFVFFISSLISRSVMHLLYNYRRSNYVRYYGFFVNYVISMILQAFFGLIASIIVMAFSRYREFRADADGAKIVGSKRMINLLIRFKELTDPEPMQAMATYCIHGETKSVYNLFSSHPPIKDRINALKKNAL
ncbi:protease HtpX [Buchnera aphidicola]|uniref:protease HtpX n=1 Tax=Buchnera aphidicola TaxID=9 RepID=UPI003463B399